MDIGLAVASEADELAPAADQLRNSRVAGGAIHASGGNLPHVHAEVLQRASTATCVASSTTSGASPARAITVDNRSTLLLIRMHSSP